MLIEWEGTFDAAHFIQGHPKCGRMHGHTYFVRVKVEAPMEEQRAYFLDYGKIKEVVQVLDHRLLVSAVTTNGERITDELVEVIWNDNGRTKAFRGTKEEICFLPMEYTSAENLAEYILKNVRALAKNASYIEVELKETPKTGAIAIWERNETDSP